MLRIGNHIYYYTQLFVKPKYIIICLILFIVVITINIYVFHNTCKRSIIWSYLCTYIALLLFSLVFNRDSSEACRYNLQLFWSYKEIIKNGNYTLLVEDFLNLIMLTPVSIMIDNLKEDCSIIKITFYVFFISLLFELLQFITGTGLFELDDLFNNTFGAFIAVFIWKNVKRKVHDKNI